MSKLCLFTLAFFIAAAAAYDIVENVQGQQYFLVPLQPLRRQRREANVAIANGQPGTIITASHQGAIVSSNGHQVDGSAFASQQFRPTGPLTVGGQVGYSHVPSGSNLNVGVQHTGRYGTDVKATGTTNLWSQGNHQLNAVGSYDRHFGGLGGTAHPNYYAGLEYKMKYGY